MTIVIVRFRTFLTQQALFHTSFITVTTKIFIRLIMLNTTNIQKHFIVTVREALNRSSSSYRIAQIYCLNPLWRNVIILEFMRLVVWLYLLCCSYLLTTSYKFISNKLFLFLVMRMSEYQMSQIIKYCFFTACRTCQTILDLNFTRRINRN